VTENSTDSATENPADSTAGVAELLASLPESAPIQRVRNYYLTDREARPRPRDFLTAMRRSDGALCLRWPGPPGDCVVRYAPSGADSGSQPDWECVEHNRFVGRKSANRVTADRVREWIRDSPPELLARESLRGTFEDGCASTPFTPDADGRAAIADGGRTGERGRGRSAEIDRVRVERYADLRDDSELDARTADALAAALPAAPGEMVFVLPRVLAAESVLEPIPGSDRAFVGEVVSDRETDCAHYVRQDRRGCWVPKREATAYELVDGATVRSEPVERESASESA